jgi:flagellar biosynthesis/type III secretory pathway protein FliH
MTTPIWLESFDEPDQPAKVPDAEMPEEQWLKVFEKGYKDGWEDGSRASAAGQKQIKAELEQSLQDLSFTLAEARVAVLKELRPVIGAVLDKVLPGAMHQILAQHLQDMVQAMFAQNADLQVHLCVAPQNISLIQRLVGQLKGVDVRIVGDPSLSEGLAYLKLGESEQKIDVEGVFSKLSQEVEAFFDDSTIEKERVNG